MTTQSTLQTLLVKLKATEIEACNKAGVKQIQEIKLVMTVLYLRLAQAKQLIN